MHGPQTNTNIGTTIISKTINQNALGGIGIDLNIALSTTRKIQTKSE
jgi:hypothetical protein